MAEESSYINHNNRRYGVKLPFNYGVFFSAHYYGCEVIVRIAIIPLEGP